MTITVTDSNPNRTDEFWTEIESAIGVLVGARDGGRLTRISKPDGSLTHTEHIAPSLIAKNSDGFSNYRSHGVYELTYTPYGQGDETLITLELK